MTWTETITNKYQVHYIICIICNCMYLCCDAWHHEGQCLHRTRSSEPTPCISSWGSSMIGLTTSVSHMKPITWPKRIPKRSLRTPAWPLTHAWRSFIDGINWAGAGWSGWQRLAKSLLPAKALILARKYKVSRSPVASDCWGAGRMLPSIQATARF